MKVARIFAVILGIAGLLVMLGTAVLCFVSLDAPARVLSTPAGARECSEALMEALETGDYAAAGKYLYGQPDLGVNAQPSGEAAAAVWQAFRDSFSYEFIGECYVSGSGMARDVQVTALEVSSVTETLSTRAHDLLTARVEAAEEMSELYDVENNFRADLIAEVMEEALTQALAEDALLVTREVTLSLIYRDGQWWVVPDTALLLAISGGVA